MGQILVGMTLIYLLSRTTFYYLHSIKPVRLDTLQEIKHKEYATVVLPDKLHPPKRFLGGTYESVFTGSRRKIFFFMFKKTSPASDAKESEFTGEEGIRPIPCSMNDLLPEVHVKPSFKLNLSITTCPQLDPLVWSNLNELITATMLPSAEQLIVDYNCGRVTTLESMKELVSIITKLKDISPALKGVVDYVPIANETKIPEGVINDCFLAQLRKTKEFSCFILDGNRKGKGTKNISLYHQSMEDFYFHHRDALGYAVNCTQMTDLDILEANAGDCKRDVTENLAKNLRQLKANITKTASMCLFKAAEQGHVCKKVSVTGFLVDYKLQQATHFTRMEFDLITNNTTLSTCEIGNQELSIEEAFVRATEYLKLKVVHVLSNI